MTVQALKPNTPDPPGATLVLGGFWIVLMLMAWGVGGAKFLPSPLEVIQSFPSLWNTDGLGEQLWVSFTTSWEAALLMLLISMLLAVATAMPLFRPLATLVSSGRFNGMVGMPLVFMSIFHSPGIVKIVLLMFGSGVFMVLSLVSMINSIPKELFDHGRTLGMGEWRVVWEVVILGRMDEVIEIFRINIAMLWMMLPGVESMFRYEGGVGNMMQLESKYLNLDKVFCIMFIILGIGLLQDWFIRYVKGVMCPYANLGLERK